MKIRMMTMAWSWQQSVELLRLAQMTKRNKKIFVIDVDSTVIHTSCKAYQAIILPLPYTDNVMMRHGHNIHKCGGHPEPSHKKQKTTTNRHAGQWLRGTQLSLLELVLPEQASAACFKRKAPITWGNWTLRRLQAYGNWPTSPPVPPIAASCTRTHRPAHQLSSLFAKPQAVIV